MRHLNIWTLMKPKSVLSVLFSVVNNSFYMNTLLKIHILILLISWLSINYFLRLWIVWEVQIQNNLMTLNI